MTNGDFGAGAADHSATLLNNASGTVETGLLNDFDQVTNFGTLDIGGAGAIAASMF